MNRLSGSQIQLFHEALLGSFDQAKLKNFLRIHLEVHLDHIANISKGNFQDIVSEVIEHFEHLDREVELLNKAIAVRPDNILLAQLANELMLHRVEIKERIPNLLTFLPDRRDQKDALVITLSEFQIGDIKPLVCIVDGREDQSHDKFFECLQHVYLPRFLRLDNETKVADYFLRWSGDRRNTVEDQLRLELSREVLEKEACSILEVANELVLLDCPVAFNSYILSGDLVNKSESMIKEFLRFWDQWPAVGMAHPLIVFLFVQYQEKKGREGRRSRRINKKIESYLKELENEEFETITFLKLPKLEGIKQSEAENWARKDDVKRLCEFHLVIERIKKLYEKESDKNGDIPMNLLEPKLFDMLVCHYSQEV